MCVLRGRVLKPRYIATEAPQLSVRALASPALQPQTNLPKQLFPLHSRTHRNTLVPAHTGSALPAAPAPRRPAAPAPYFCPLRVECLAWSVGYIADQHDPTSVIHLLRSSLGW